MQPLLPLAILRSTKQKRFQSLKQASLTGLSAMPTHGVESLDAADLSAIATMLRLAMRSSVMNILRIKSRAESDSRHKPNGATHGSPAFRASSVPLFEPVAHRQHAFRWLRQRSGRLPTRSCILDGEAIVSTADLLFRSHPMSWEQRPSGTGNGCVLVVVKDAKIKGFMEANGIHLRKKTRCSSSTVDEAAQEAGASRRRPRVRAASDR